MSYFNMTNHTIAYSTTNGGIEEITVSCHYEHRTWCELARYAENRAMQDANSKGLVLKRVLLIDGNAA